DFDLSRQIQAVAAKNYIDNTIRPAIAAWLGYNDFNTAHGQTTEAGFYGYNTALLQPAKGNPIQLDILKQFVVDRKDFVDNTRIPQPILHLGDISQDVNSGEILSYSGLY